MTRRAVAESIGTAFLVAAVVGSGITAERLAAGNAALALLANAIATGAALTALILAFAPLSGAHFNPIVSIAFALNGELVWRETLAYLAAQFIGAIAGVMTASAMFDLPLFSASQKVRTGLGQWLGEFVAAFGLVGIVIAVSRRHKVLATALAVPAYITAAYWFTSSTSFANPAVTVARSFSDTFAGIRAADAPAFIAAQIAGGIAAAYVFNWLVPREAV